MRIEEKNDICTFVALEHQKTFAHNHPDIDSDHHIQVEENLHRCTQAKLDQGLSPIQRPAKQAQSAHRKKRQNFIQAD
jgi:hypothetical protein